MTSGDNHTYQGCPLCAGESAEHFWDDRHRYYLRCPRCRLVYVPPRFHLSREEEKAEYDLHQNDLGDQGYRRFLNRLFAPMQALLMPAGNGLDFGCGPGPALSSMFEAAGHRVALYDPNYARHSDVLDRPYDFITATEVLEHLRHPEEELARLWKMLQPNGRLGIMTKLVKDRAAFGTWHYKNDATHICFFSRPTFEWLANQWKAEVEFIGADVIIFTKTSKST